MLLWAPTTDLAVRCPHGHVGHTCSRHQASVQMRFPEDLTSDTRRILSQEGSSLLSEERAVERSYKICLTLSQVHSLAR